MKVPASRKAREYRYRVFSWPQLFGRVGVAPLQSAAGPLLVLFHGLEGSSASHYALAFADFARARGIDYAVLHFRGDHQSLIYV